MEVICQEQTWFRNHLVRQPKQNIKYRLSNFIVKQVIDDGILLYNNVTGCLLFFKSENEVRNNFDFLVGIGSICLPILLMSVIGLNF